MMFFRNINSRLDLTNELLNLVLAQGTKIMAGIDDFKAALATLASEVGGLPNAIAALEAAHAADDDAAFEDAASKLKDMTASITAVTTVAVATPVVVPPAASTQPNPGAATVAGGASAS